MASMGETSGLSERVMSMFPPGTALSDQWTSAGCRVSSDEVTVLATRAGDTQLHGIPVSLEHTGYEFYYGPRHPVNSVDEWLESVGLGFSIMLETGYAYFARRRVLEDYIELRAEGGWPQDDRFYYYPYAPRGDTTGFGNRQEDPDLDVSLPNARIEQGRLIEWVVATENNATAGPHLGQALTSHDEHHGAILELLEVADGVPNSVRLELGRIVVFGAGPRYSHVVTHLQDPLLTILGFRPLSDSLQVIGTDLVSADPVTAHAIVESEVAQGPLWGCDRDVAGRPLPSSRFGKLLHRLRWPHTGQWARTSAVVVPTVDKGEMHLDEDYT